MRTRDELFLAYRHAKATLFFERRGVGLIDLARFESKLVTRLDDLSLLLARNGGWFDQLPTGCLWITPKKLRVSDPRGFGNSPDDVRRIGAPRPPVDLDIQVRYIPSPECAIVEVLFLWQFGPVLQSLLSPHAIGYRLDLRRNQAIRTSRRLFEYWPRVYDHFRTVPVDKALQELKKKGSVLVLSADLANFYDTVDPSFLLNESFLDELESANYPINITTYRKATASLLRLYSDYRSLAHRRTGLDWSTGIPIGSLTSRLVANLVLATFDHAVESQQTTVCYRRYVDDFVIVAKADTSDPGDLADVVETYVPHVDVDRNTGDFQLNANLLLRSGSEFKIQRTKCRAYHLIGTAGRDFLLAIRNDFGRLVSEERAFLDPTVLSDGTFQELVRVGAPGRPLTVLRDVDRSRLEHFALSIRLRSLERMSVLVDNKHARPLIQSALNEVLRFFDGDGDWVENFEAANRMLRLAIRVADWDDVRHLINYMDDIWRDEECLHKSVRQLFHRNRPVPSRSAWVWLRNYLHARRIETISSVIRQPEHGSNKFPAWFRSEGVMERTQVVRWRAFVQRARLLAAADLRTLDREDDAFGPNSRDKKCEFEHDDAELNKRVQTVQQFVDVCAEIGDRSWNIAPFSLFLCTRPPSYFDIARRWLYRSERRGFRHDVFEKLLELVNAIRGTQYADPVGIVIDERNVRIPHEPRVGQRTVRDPRLILGNLVSPRGSFEGSAGRVNGSMFGKPVLTIERLRGLAHILDATSKLARRDPDRRNLLVLPELSLPRAWFRSVANYIARWGSFGLIAGLEYLHHLTSPWVFNQAWITIPGPWQSAAAWPWTKERAARGEADELRQLGVGFKPSLDGLQSRRTVVDSPYGLISVLICSELIEAGRISDLVGRVEVVAVPSWNRDTASYDHLIQSAGVQLHSIIAVANNGHYSDCRAWAPMTARWQRDLCRLIERDENTVVFVDLPLAALRAFREENGLGQRNPGQRREEPEWRPLPPFWPR